MRPVTWPEDVLDAAWSEARSHWSVSVDLRRPKQTPGPIAIAYIDLATRQTWVDFKRLSALGLQSVLPALLAHEVGHHLWFPHTVVKGKRMLRFLREELTALALIWETPTLGQQASAGQCDYLLNLLYDLLINNSIASAYEADLVALYQALRQDPADPVFGFYLGLYEALWYLPEGVLVTPATAGVLAAIDPDWRRRADVFAQSLVNSANQHPMLLVRLLLTLEPFLRAADHVAATQAAIEGEAGIGDGEVLSAEDVERVLQSEPGEAEARAWRRMQRAEDVWGGGSGDPLADSQRTLKGLVEPTAVALATYRQMARKLDVDLPRSEAEPPGLTPGPPEIWEVGDRMGDIDWMATLTRDGVAIPGLTLRKRAWLPEAQGPGDEISPWIEIYVDSSGSMPDPVAQVNYGILAAFVLAGAAIEAGGRVRVIQFSHVFDAMPDFVRSMGAVEPALLRNINGGTRFPWEELERSGRAYRHIAHVHRVVVTDSDFYYNYSHAAAYTLEGTRDDAVAMATQGPRNLVIIMRAQPDPDVVSAIERVGGQFVFADAWDAVPAVARDLARALFPRDRAA